MELLLDIFFLSAWGRVPRGSINEELGETPQRNIKDFFLDPHSVAYTGHFFSKIPSFGSVAAALFGAG